MRDETGRTYVAGTVALDSLKLSALRTAVAMAVASGAQSLEAAAVVTDGRRSTGRTSRRCGTLVARVRRCCSRGPTAWCGAVAAG